MKVQLLAIIILLAASGCGKTSPKQSTSGQSCEAQISDLSLWMTKLGEESVSNNAAFFGNADPPVADVSTVRPMNNVRMTLDSDVILVEGEAIVAIRNGAIDPSEIEPGTTSIKRLSLALHGMKDELVKYKAAGAHSNVDTHRLNLVIDKLTPWNVVVAAVKTASMAEYSELEIVFKTPPRVATFSPPPASSLTKEIAALREFSERFSEARLAEPYFDPIAIRATYDGPDKLGLLLMLFANCPPVKEVVDTVGEQDPDKRQAHLTDGVVSAIQQCQCKVEIPAIKELYWFSANDGIGKPGIGSVNIVLANSETSDAAIVTAAGDSTWQDVHTKVLSLASSSGTPKLVFKVDKPQ